MNKIVLGIMLVALTGCGKLENAVATGMKGYAVICVDGTSYVLVQNDNSSTITPHLNAEGKPRECK